MKYISLSFTPVRTLEHDVNPYISVMGTYSNRVVQYAVRETVSMFKCYSSLACFLIVGWLVGNVLITGIVGMHAHMCVYAQLHVHATLGKECFTV